MSTTTTTAQGPSAFTEAELRQALASLGLKLSAKEMSALENCERVSLESRPLSEFAKLLTQAEAQARQDDPKTDFSFKAIQHELMGAARASGCTGTKVVKIGRCSLRVHWPPAVSICCQF